MDEPEKSLTEGETPQDPPSGNYLRWVFWKLATEMEVGPKLWVPLIHEYANNPDYLGRSSALPEERAQRLTIALTGGNIVGLQPDLTWKRFNEGLVILKIQSLKVTVTAKRGNWGDKQTVWAYTRPQSDHLRTINKEDEEQLRESVGRTLDRYFENTAHTATRVMDHILLKLFWQLINKYKIDNVAWKRLLVAYVNNPENCPQLKSRRNDARHNLQQSVRRTKKLTWRFFLKSLKAIDVRGIDIAFLFTTESEKEVEIATKIDLTKHTFKSGKDKDE